MGMHPEDGGPVGTRTGEAAFVSGGRGVLVSLALAPWRGHGWAVPTLCCNSSSGLTEGGAPKVRWGLPAALQGAEGGQKVRGATCQDQDGWLQGRRTHPQAGVLPALRQEGL